MGMKLRFTYSISPELKSYMELWERLIEVFPTVKVVGGSARYSKKAVRLNRTRTVTWRVSGAKQAFWRAVFLPTLPKEIIWNFKKGGGGTVTLELPMSAEESTFFENVAGKELWKPPSELSILPTGERGKVELVAKHIETY